ncbi:hypothetical protein [Umezawaea sp. NPDC059074]|uniref:hypothetical protein n=1 Tax=Umezawaea sp. NPDC059074 TaxID=3346716 RepID=UPI0036C60BD9
MLLSSPAVSLLVFAGCALLGGVAYKISDLSRLSMVRETGPRRVMPLIAPSLWWRMRRILWKRSKLKAVFATTRDLAEVFIRVVVPVVSGLFLGLAVVLCYRALYWLKSGRFDASVPVISVVGCAFGAASIMAFLYYSLQLRRDSLWPFPVFLFRAGQVGKIRRVRFLRLIFLFIHLRYSVVLSVAIGNCATIAVFRDLLDKKNSRVIWSLWPHFIEVDWLDQLVALVFAGELLSLLVGLALYYSIQLLMPLEHAAVVVNECLNSKIESPGPVADGRKILGALELRREELDRAARALRGAGRRVDYFSYNHPVASILYGCGQFLQNYLKRTDSLSYCHPSAIVDILRDVTIVLAGPAHLSFYAKVGQAVDAFDSDGSPRSALRVKPASRLAALIVRVIDPLDKFSKIATSVWAIFTLIVVVILIVAGTLDLTKIQIQK